MPMKGYLAFLSRGPLWSLNSLQNIWCPKYVKTAPSSQHSECIHNADRWEVAWLICFNMFVFVSLYDNPSSLHVYLILRWILASFVFTCDEWVFGVQADLIQDHHHTFNHHHYTTFPWLGDGLPKEKMAYVQREHLGREKSGFFVSNKAKNADFC